MQDVFLFHKNSCAYPAGTFGRAAKSLINPVD
jgi:hypothetical protein